MRRPILFSLLVLFFVTIPFQAGLSQTTVIDITIGKQTIHLAQEAIQNARKRIGITSQAKAPPSTRKGVTDKKTATTEKVGADQPEKSLVGVKNLVTEFNLDKPTEQNPKLAFGDTEITSWYKKKLNETDLRYEFAARQIILEAADKQKVPIRDQEMLSHAAQDVIAKMKEEKALESANTNQTGKPEPPKTVTGSTATQPPEVSPLICKGDTSQEKLSQAWAALNASQGAMNKDNLEMALACTRSAINKWQSQADEQQARRQQAGECRTTPSVSQKDAYFASYWALADIGTAWFIRGQALNQQRKWREAREAYKMVIDRYSCAYTWDPRGWFWRTADGAQEQYEEIQYK